MFAGDTAVPRTISFGASADVAVLVRPLLAEDIPALLPVLIRDPASPLTADDYLAKSADRQYRPEWTWLAVEAETGRLLAAAVWWGPPAEAAPGALDAVVVADSVPAGARVALAAAVLDTAHEVFRRDLGLTRPPEYHVFVPGDWRARPDVVAALEWRTAAAERAGLGSLLERLRYEWTPEAGVPAAAGRLTFHPEADDEVFVDLFARVLAGSLDVGSTSEAAEIGAEAQARSDVEFYRDVMLGERDWWRVAKDADGRVVGFGFPSRNPGAHVVGYLGVLPEFRGRGYVDEILAEITRQLAEDVGVGTVRSDTDLVNRPMAAAMERAGYRNFARRLVFSAG